MIAVSGLGSAASAQTLVAQFVNEPGAMPGYTGALANPYDVFADAPRAGLVDDRRSAAPLLDPLGLSGYSVGGQLAQPLAIGSAALTGAVDFEYRRGSRVADRDSRSQVLRVGPRLSLYPDYTTHLYYRYRYDSYGEPTAGGALGADQVGAGVAQTVPLGERSALFRLEYGVETPRTATRAPLAGGREAVNLSGAVPLPWGLTASFEADYGFESESVAGLRSAFRAGLSGWLAANLRANISMSYAQDDESADAQTRKRALGLNLHYAY